MLPTSDLDIENFDSVLKVNTKGVMLCIRAVSKVMMTQDVLTHKGRHGEERILGRGSIVNVGSGASYIGSPNMMAYVASKHAVLGITKAACKLSQLQIEMRTVSNDVFGNSIRQRKAANSSERCMSIICCYTDVGA